MLKRLLLEPLVHFLVLGAAIFLVFGVVDDVGEAGTDDIVVSAGRIAQLTEIFARTWQRPPTGEELEGLIAEHVREEIYYREALAMGLDRDDTIVRRRLRQKLEFITDDLVNVAEPTEEQLEAYLADHVEQFRVPARFSFHQIYFDPGPRGRQATKDAESLLARLTADPGLDPTGFGDSLMLSNDHEGVSELEAARQLGRAFAASLAEAPVGVWSGPVESGFGLHLILVRERESERVPDLAEVRDAVERDWRSTQSREASDAFYRGLRERYSIRIELPDGKTRASNPCLAEVGP